MPDLEDDYDCYPCLVDGAHASIYVNQRFERESPPEAETRYEVTFPLREPGPHGIGTAAEAEALNAIEEALIARLAERRLLYVGRLRSRAVWEVVFYGPDGQLAAVREVARAASPDGRSPAVRSAPDPEWRYYRELLMPDAERRQWMDDRRMVQVLREQGDGLRTPRRVDHQTSFATAPARDAFVAAVTSAGFTLVSAAEDATRERPFGAHVYRADGIELDHIHDVVMTLVDAAALQGGAYEGWTASIERG
ncbi:MAG: DUF695 domain-containing protein [Myxococcota bacterium]|nr:DUF695 domain-containing protein [Myxococcota bacterium]